MTDILQNPAGPTLKLAFGRDGNARPHLLTGWAPPEEGFCWTLGAGAALRLQMPTGQGEPYLELHLNPYTHPVATPRRLIVRVNGQMVGDDAITGEGTASYRLPPALGHPENLLVELLHDAGKSPAEHGLGADTRPLGFMVRSLAIVHAKPSPRADVTVLPPFPLPEEPHAQEQAIRRVTGLTPHALALSFESLGHNCEFGMFLKRLDVTAISLLRFAGITLDQLLAGMEHGFEGAGENVFVGTHPTRGGEDEYIVHERRYNFGLHSFFGVSQATPEEVKAAHGARLRFAARQFGHTLRDGKRLFVFQRPGAILRARALPLLHRLQHFGPNALLYVDQDSGLPSGAVEQVGHGLFHGKLAHLAPADDAGNLDFAGWLGLCANAYRLWRPYRDKFVVS
jgi:hypothetical protein